MKNLVQFLGPAAVSIGESVIANWISSLLAKSKLWTRAELEKETRVFMNSFVSFKDVDIIAKQTANIVAESGFIHIVNTTIEGEAINHKAGLDGRIHMENTNNETVSGSRLSGGTVDVGAGGTIQMPSNGDINIQAGTQGLVISGEAGDVIIQGGLNL